MHLIYYSTQLTSINFHKIYSEYKLRCIRIWKEMRRYIDDMLIYQNKLSVCVFLPEYNTQKRTNTDGK